MAPQKKTVSFFGKREGVWGGGSIMSFFCSNEHYIILVLNVTNVHFCMLYIFVEKDH